jgi:predicted HicB family RNase H-like nuclease
MQVDERVEPAEPDGSKQLNVYMSPELRKRLKSAAAKRGTSESSTAVKFLERSLDWFEKLTDDESEAV